MKTLIIHPYDNTTSFLEDIYYGKDYTVIDNNISKKELINAIKMHDKIIMLGHGSEDGLFGFNRLIINSKFVYLLKTKICICIWCNADKFVEKYKLKSPFYTGMFISECNEADIFNIKSSINEISYSNMLFASILSMNIDDEKIDINNILEKYNGKSDVINFNSKRLYNNIN